MSGERMVANAVVNMRSAAPQLVLDGVAFPYMIDKARGIRVEAVDDNVHLVTVSIQVDHSVTVVDRAIEVAEIQRALLDDALGSQPG